MSKIIFSLCLVLSFNVNAQEYWAGETTVIPASSRKYEVGEMIRASRERGELMKSAYTALVRCGRLERDLPKVHGVLTTFKKVRTLFFESERDYAEATSRTLDDTLECALTFRREKSKKNSEDPDAIVVVNEKAWGKGKSKECPEEERLYMMHELLHVAGMTHGEDSYVGKLQETAVECLAEAKLREQIEGTEE